MKNFFYFLFILFAVHVFPVHAQTIDELESKINERNAEIRELEEEIQKLESQINTTSKQAQTLEGALRQLELADKKLAADIRLTERRIAQTNAVISELAELIEDKGVKIKNGNKALKESIRNIHELESRSFIEIIFSDIGFSNFWSGVFGLEQFQKEVNRNMEELKKLKLDHEEAKEKSEQEKRNLIAFNNRLADQKEIVRQNKLAQQALLKETKNQESNYKKLLAEQLAKKEALERELAEFEGQLRIEIDPESLPRTGKGILRWPVVPPVITQYFGNTPFATANPQVYGGGGHNGIDLRAAPGTPVMNAANGTVINVGDTDKQCYKASYGKWVLVKHYNGLATLYAHLSLIRALPGQEVSAGEVLGYSGNTGYSTGPHLHFAVYAANAVSVINKQSRVCGTTLTLPAAPTNGYLNPLSYL